MSTTAGTGNWDIKFSTTSDTWTCNYIVNNCKYEGYIPNKWILEEESPNTPLIQAKKRKKGC